MSSPVDIANRALQKLGAARISSLSEESVEGRACISCYEILRDSLQSKHPWRFTITRATLAADGTAPDWGKANSFTLPSDFLALLSDYPERNVNTNDWEIEDGKIYTNDSAPLYLRYQKRVTDSVRFPPTFCEALSSLMAMEMCEELTQSNTKWEKASSDYKAAVSEAKKKNAFDSIPAEPPEDTWITVRQ